MRMNDLERELCALAGGTDYFGYEETVKSNVTADIATRLLEMQKEVEAVKMAKAEIARAAEEKAAVEKAIMEKQIAQQAAIEAAVWMKVFSVLTEGHNLSPNQAMECINDFQKNGLSPQYCLESVTASAQDRKSKEPPTPKPEAFGSWA